jgi:acyl-coenzyme A thioesterase PaaI-like protein
MTQLGTTPAAAVSDAARIGTKMLTGGQLLHGGYVGAIADAVCTCCALIY